MELSGRMLCMSALDCLALAETDGMALLLLQGDNFYRESPAIPL